MNGASPTTPLSPKSNGIERTHTMVEGRVKVEVTYDTLDVNAALNNVRDPEAGAMVMFAGTTRNNFERRPVINLEYSAYIPLALQTMLNIALSIHTDYSLIGIYVIHRLGTVPIGEESILICVSAPHRTAAWRAGEHALERIKESVEIWKLEKFGKGLEGESEAIWRANRDGAQGQWLSPTKTASVDSDNVSEDGTSTIMITL